MEPHREEQNKAPPPGAEPKPKRFRIVKLEDRVAPRRGGKTGITCPLTADTCNLSGGATCDMNICW